MIGRTEHRSHLSGMALILSSWLEFGVAPEEVVDLFPAVVIRVNHLSALPCRNLYRKRRSITLHREVGESSLALSSGSSARVPDEFSACA